MPKYKHTVEIKLEQTFGSEFQQQCAIQMLAALIQSYKLGIENRHKDNRVFFNIQDAPNL